MTNLIDVTTATTKELLEFFNANSEAQVKRFADRKTAERRVNELIASMPAQEVEVDGCGHANCPECGVHLSNGLMTFDHALECADGVKANAGMTKDWQCMACNHEWGAVRYAKQALSEVRSAAMVESWANPEVAAKRATRHFVRVDGVEYRSVRAAFLALNLPLKEHIKFRMELKAEGQLNAYRRSWEAIENV